MEHNASAARVEIPIACTLPAGEQARRGEVIARLLDGVRAVAELDDGFAFQYPGSASWATTLLTFIVRERECCPFFAFELAFEANGGPLWLHLRGPAGVKEFIRDQWLAQVNGEAPLAPRSHLSE